MVIPPNIAGLDLPHAPADSKLHRILTGALDRRCDRPHNSEIYWNADYFNLDRVKVFQTASAIEQTEILQLANRALLEEAYCIEKAGIGYMAKMVLLSETTEERMLYGLFTADEVTHLSQISGFLSNTEVIDTHNPFLQLLSETVETSDKSVLLFVIQIVLEGWGLSHYRSLANSCQNPVLSQIFREFLNAESRHHGTGVTLFNPAIVTQSEQSTMVEILMQFLGMIRVGPQSVVEAIAQVKGDLSNAQRIRVLEELDAEHHSATRLNLLKSLMKENGTIVEILESHHAFQPIPADQCAH